MNMPAALASPRIWGPHNRQHTKTPRFFVMSDMTRLPDPTVVFAHVPKGSAVVLRHTDPRALEVLARTILPQAHRFGLKVLISNNVRLAQRLGADGVHLSEQCFLRGRWRRTLRDRKPGFLITAALHGRKAEKTAGHLAIDTVMVSPVFATKSHPTAKPCGVLNLARLAQESRQSVVALGGVTPQNVRRLQMSAISGVAAIGAWRA